MTTSMVSALMMVVASVGGGADEKDSGPAGGGTGKVSSFYDFSLPDIDGQEQSLSKFKGDVCLVVNVARQCGLTPQYTGLEALYKKYKDQGFTVLGFPANNFGAQEPGTNAEIKSFCKSKYQVSFPMFGKISVKGDDQHPLYRFLTNYPDEKVAGEVRWNFQKYLVARDGKVIAMFGPKTAPEDKQLADAVESALAAARPKKGS